MTRPEKVKRRRPEQMIQRALCERLAWQKPDGVWWCHIANGGYRKPIEAAIMAGLGVKRGAPDLIFITQGRTFGLELKAPGGKLSPAQVECHEQMRRAGCTVGVAAGVDEATDLLREWGVL